MKKTCRYCQYYACGLFGECRKAKHVKYEALDGKIFYGPLAVGPNDTCDEFKSRKEIKSEEANEM